MTNNQITKETKKHAYINSLWLIAEKSISTLGLFLVSTYVAKYIGPGMVGVIALAVTSFQIVQVIAQFGSENIIIIRLSKKINSGIALGMASIIVRAFLFITVSLPVLWFSYNSSYIEFVFSSAVAIATFFITIDLVATYNDTVLNSRLNATFNLFGLLVALIMRYLIVELNLNVMWLTFPIVATSMLPFGLRFFYFSKNKHLKNSRCTSHHLRYILLAGSTLLIANISVTVYPRINIFLLSHMTDVKILGIYSVAVTLATSWSFILLAVVTSYFPEIYNERDEHKAILKAARLNVYILIVSLCIICGFALVGKYVIAVLYGPAFSKVWLPSLILCAGTTLSTLGTVASRFILKYSGYRYLTYKSLINLIFCIPLSWLLISLWGLEGAAYSVVCIELISLTILNYWFQRGIVMKMHQCLFSCTLSAVVRR